MFTKTPPSNDGFYRMRNIDKLTVAEKRDGMWHWIDTEGTADDAWLIKNGWEFGDEVLFASPPATAETMRERIATAALQGLLSASDNDDWNYGKFINNQSFAVASVKLADALIAELGKEKPC